MRHRPRPRHVGRQDRTQPPPQPDLGGHGPRSVQGLVRRLRPRPRQDGRPSPYLPADLWQLFPDRLDDEGEPHGVDAWEPLDQVAELVTNSIAPGKSPETVFEHYSIPAFTAGVCQRSRSCFDQKQQIHRESESVLVSKLNPQTPRVWLPE